MYGFFTFCDQSKEKATTSFNMVPLEADGSNYALITAAFATIKAAFQGVTAGSIFEEALVAERNRLTNVYPTTGHREDKWLVRYQDNTTLKVYGFELPNADDTNVVYSTGTDFWNLAVGVRTAQMTAVITAVEGNIKSPTGGAITVLSVQRVGRNT